MSVQYLLDGYNILHQIPLDLQGSLQDQREQLIRWLELAQPQGSIKNAVTIVFDGRSGMFSGASSSSIKIIFSQDETADLKIKSMVTQSAHKKNIVVVSNDRDIQYAVRALGAKVMSVQEFLGKDQSTKLGKAGALPSSKKEDVKRISSVVESKITSEMAEIWLKRKKENK